MRHVDAQLRPGARQTVPKEARSLAAILIGEGSLPLRCADLLMAACYLRALREVQPHGPYFLAGHSSGGLVAFEMARQLHAADQEVGLVALLDAFGGHRYSLPLPARLARWARFQVRRIRRHARGFAQAQGWEKLVYLGQKSKSRIGRATDRLNALATGAGDDDQMRRALRSVEETAVLAERRYVPQVYAGHLTLFRAQERPATIDHDPEEGWREIAVGGVDIHEVPGTHYDLLSEPNVGALAKQLKACMHTAMLPTRKESVRPALVEDAFARSVELTS